MQAGHYKNYPSSLQLMRVCSQCIQPGIFISLNFNGSVIFTGFINIAGQFDASIYVLRSRPSNNISMDILPTTHDIFSSQIKEEIKM